VLVKAVEDAALAMASIYRSVGLPLPDEDAAATPACAGFICDSRAHDAVRRW
jgi:hypothetical protein